MPLQRDPVDMMDDAYAYKTWLWLVSGIIVAFFLWAGLTEINQQVRGDGRVITSGKMRTIQHLEGGIVNDINVKEGQRVEQGQVLFVVTNQRAVADLAETDLNVDTQTIRKARLMAELEEKDEVVFDPELEKRHPEIAATERNIFNAQRQEFKQKIMGLQERYKQKVLKLNELGTTVRNLEQEASVADRQLQIKKKLRASGAISESQYLESESLVKSFTTQVSRSKNEIPITRAELAEIENLIEETRKTKQSQVGEDLNQVNVEINRQNERGSASRDQVSRTTITSPVKGIVNKVYVNTIGGVVKPGEVVADIIPLDEALIVEGRIGTKDRGKVWVGLPVVAKISAYDYSVYGGIKGELSYVSADSFIDNKGGEFYQVRVTLDSDKIGVGKEIYPGMTVDMNILAGKISVLRAILKPIMDIKDNALTEK